MSATDAQIDAHIDAWTARGGWCFGSDGSLRGIKPTRSEIFALVRAVAAPAQPSPQCAVCKGYGRVLWNAEDDTTVCPHCGGSKPKVQPAPAVLGLTVSQEPKYTVNGSAIINRASGEPIPADEPVFIFRARDKHACSMIGEYMQFCDDPAHIEAVQERFIQFGEWADTHPERMKEPDTAAMLDLPGPIPRQLSDFPALQAEIAEAIDRGFLCVSGEGAVQPPAPSIATEATRQACFARARQHPVVLEIMADCASCIDTENAAQCDPKVRVYEGLEWVGIEAEMRAEAAAIRAQDPEIWPVLMPFGSEAAQPGAYPVVSRWTGAAQNAGPRARVWVQFTQDGPEVEFSPASILPPQLEADRDALLEIARQTGLRQHLHGINATDARELLSRFVNAVAAAGLKP